MRRPCPRIESRPMSEPAALTAEATVAALLCVSCEYDLRGMARDARCPECGAQVDRSYQHHEALLARGEAPLWMSRPAWLRRIGIGCALALSSGVAISVAAVLGAYDNRGGSPAY